MKRYYYHVLIVLLSAWALVVMAQQPATHSLRHSVVFESRLAASMISGKPSL